MKTKVTELLGIEYPIIQGGMAWVAEYHLAAAVSEAGGLGLIGAASAPADWVRDQIREAKKITDKPFGVNIMLMHPQVEELALKARFSQHTLTQAERERTAAAVEGERDRVDAALPWWKRLAFRWLFALR